MLQVAELTGWMMQGSKQCWLTPLLSTVFFEKEQLVRDSFEIKGLGYVEWLEARLRCVQAGWAVLRQAAQQRAVSISQSAVQQARVLYLSFVAKFLRSASLG